MAKQSRQPIKAESVAAREMAKDVGDAVQKAEAELADALGPQLIPSSDVDEKQAPIDAKGADLDRDAELAELREMLEVMQKENRRERDERDSILKELDDTKNLVERMQKRDNLQNLETAAAVEAVLQDRQEMLREFFERLKTWEGPIVIQIHTDSNPNANRPVPCAVNGKRVLLPRGKPVEVEAKHVATLANAYRVVTAKEVDRNGNPIQRAYVHQTVPFSILRGPEMVHLPNQVM